MVVGKSKYQMYIRFSVYLQIMVPSLYLVMYYFKYQLFLNINIILKNNFKKLFNSLEFFLFNVRGMKTIVKL